jgi:hypothetical protein
MPFNDPDGQLAAERLVPQLRGSDYEPQSVRNVAYNCFAWAAREFETWMEPPGTASWAFWPADLPTWDTLENYVRAFAQREFAECLDGSLESGYEKIALFVDEGGAPLHAARQLESGRWTSKLGKGIDIEHQLATIDGSPAIGRVAVFMKRVWPGHGRYWARTSDLRLVEAALSQLS